MPEFESRELKTGDLKPRISNAALLKTDLNSTVQQRDRFPIVSEMILETSCYNQRV